MRNPPLRLGLLLEAVSATRLESRTCRSGKRGPDWVPTPWSGFTPSSGISIRGPSLASGSPFVARPLGCPREPLAVRATVSGTFWALVAGRRPARQEARGPGTSRDHGLLP